MHISRDKLWKSIIEDFWADFVRYFFPEINHLIDFEREAVFLDKDLAQLFPERAAGDRHVDMLMQVFLLDGSDRWFLIHAEVQGYDDPDFAHRMFAYYTRIRERHNRDVAALVIYTNKNQRYQPNEYRHGFAGTEVSLRFKTCALAQLGFEELHRAGNPFGLVMQVGWLGMQAKRMPAAKFDRWLFEQKAALYRTMLAEGFDKARIRRFVAFMQLYVRFRDPATEHQFHTEILHEPELRPSMGILELITEEATRIAQSGEQIGIAKGEQIGIAKGEQIGIAKGEQIGIARGQRRKTLEFMQQLLVDTDFDAGRIAALAGGSAAAVEAIQARLQAGNHSLEGLSPD